LIKNKKLGLLKNIQVVLYTDSTCIVCVNK